MGGQGWARMLRRGDVGWGGRRSGVDLIVRMTPQGTVPTLPEGTLWLLISLRGSILPVWGLMLQEEVESRQPLFGMSA